MLRMPKSFADAALVVRDRALSAIVRVRRRMQTGGNYFPLWKNLPMRLCIS